MKQTDPIWKEETPAGTHLPEKYCIIILPMICHPFATHAQKMEENHKN